MSHGGSANAVYTAIAANIAIAIAKFGGYFFTGSGAMLAEAIHSVADVGNQGLLAVGMRRAHKPADAVHPDGYGREAFVWALISAVGIFFLGCGATVLHGLESLKNNEHHGIEGSGVALAILGVSFLLEGTSGIVAIRVSMQHARERGISLWRHLRTTEDPFEIAILMEDSAAMVGILIAVLAIVLADITQQTFWDPMGSIFIGGLLGCIAIMLIRLNRGLLVGRSINEAELDHIRQVISRDPAVDAVTRNTAVVVGTEDYSVRAGVDFNGELLAAKVLEGRDLNVILASLQTPEELHRWLGTFAEELLDVLGGEIDRIEAQIRLEIPRATQIELEPERAERPSPG